LKRTLSYLAVLVFAPTLFSTATFASSLAVGFISYDVTSPGSTGEFDIVNETGPNSTPFPDTTFPVTTSLNMSSLGLTVHFSDGSTQTFGSSYFTLNPDGLSWDGGTIPIGGANPQPTSATLTGSFSPTSVDLNDGTSTSILSTFTASVASSSPPNLQDGDLGIISATTGTGTGGGGGSVPEPGTWLLMTTAVCAFLLTRTLRRGALPRLWNAARTGIGPAILIAVLAMALPAAQAAVQLNTTTSPGSGVAGVDFVNVTGSGFPSGHGTIPAAQMTISFALTCGGAAVASTNPTTVTLVLGSTYRSHVMLPATLGTNTYFVSLSGTTSDTTPYASSNCSAVQVTHTSSTLSACVPTSSLGIIAPVTGPVAVKALVPNGAWGSSTTGVQVVQLETGGGPIVPPASVPTAAAVNSCAGNPATGQGVCVANNTSVYLLSSSNAVTTLTSGSNGSTGFSGGSCFNCGVAVNALTNEAVIAMGHSGGSGSALQTLHLSNNTFDTPFVLANHVTENISIDPTRGYVLSPNESNIYDIVQMNSSTGAMTGEFGLRTGDSGEDDSAAEDCATGIALTVSEFTNQVFMADLTQATFTPGTPGTWTAPHSTTSIIGSYSAGLSGVTVAPGSAHLATVTGEFGGSSFSVLQLPATSGSGTPAIVDYAYVPCITGFTAGLDPHTVSAYTSPNDGKAYTVFASSPPPSILMVADMAGILARPRMADGHTVIGDAGPGTCLAAGDGVIRSVSTH
jgi:hypothetical protein